MNNMKRVLSRLLTTAAAAMLCLWISPMAIAQDQASPADMPSTSAPAAPAPTKVTIGAYVNDIKEVDLASNSYNVDLYVWLRWNNPDIDPSVTMEAMNPRDAWMTAKRLNEQPIKLEDGSYYNVIRYLGMFSSKLNVSKYPFDEQTLSMIFEDSQLSTKDLEFVPDQTGSVTNPDLVIPGWIAKPVVVRVENKPYPTSWGLDGSNSDIYSRAYIEVPVTRPVLASAIKLFFPLLIVLAMGVFVFFLRPRMVESKISLAATVLLTLVALQFTTMSALPSVSYLTMVEFIYAVSFIFTVYVLVVSLLTAWSSRDPESVEAVQFDRRAASIGFLGYAVALVLTLLGFLT
jgi:hypothetical protein